MHDVTFNSSTGFNPTVRVTLDGHVYLSRRGGPEYLQAKLDEATTQTMFNLRKPEVMQHFDEDGLHAIAVTLYAQDHFVNFKGRES